MRPTKAGRRFTELPASLVIDASIAHAAGGEGATAPESKLARDCLQAVLDNAHDLVMSPEIITEWNAHQSNFARRWRVRMAARRRIRRIESQFDVDLRARLRAATRTDKDWAVLEKDCILIEAAIVADKSILSLDEIARGLFRNIGARVGEIRGIIWLNPHKPEDLVVEWILSGCVITRQRTLSAGK